MKNLIAIATVLFASNSFAFMNDNNDVQSMASGKHFAAADTTGNATGEGEASFSMSFTGKGRTSGDFKGKGNTDTNVDGNFYGADREYYYRPQNYAK